MNDQKKTINVCTWNLCLGLQYKLNYVKEILIKEDVDILCLQETELEEGLDMSILNINGYELETDLANKTIRSVVYIKTTLNYERIPNRGLSQNLIILKITQQNLPHLFIAAIYRPWKDVGGLTQENAFADQVNDMKRLIPRNVECIVLGDFNLNYAKRNNRNVVNRTLTQILMNLVENHSLEQMVSFDTWSRTVNGHFKSSILDHVYANENGKIKSVTPLSIPISDHVPVKVEYEFQNKSVRKMTMVRNWKGYSKEKWLELLRGEDWTMSQEIVQDISNHLELKILKILQILAPVEEQQSKNCSYLLPPHLIKMRRRRKNLFKNAQRRKSAEDLKRCRKMDKQIRHMDFQNQRNKIRQKLQKGDNATLWEAVNIAKGGPSNGIPEVIVTQTGQCFSGEERPQAFADYFQEKVDNIVNNTLIPDNPDCGINKVTVENAYFFSYEKVLQTMVTLKSKKCYGYDNIPLLVLKDGAEILASPYSKLFEKIYQTKQLPDQWKISRTIPLFKKGNKKNINSYRPISNLCSASKIFERLMLNRLSDIETTSNVNLTGKNQHGFKKGRSTVTALKEIQSQIARQIDEGHYVAMGSLDLTAAFDVVDINLLMKRIVTSGLPSDWTELLEAWLRDRAAFVEVSSHRSMIYNVNIGTVQGSILGPLLFSLFVSPVFGLYNIIAYADDTYTITSAKTKENAVFELGEALTNISLWFKSSGLKVNEEKTEIAIFYKNNCNPADVLINGINVRTKNTIKVLGIMMDTTLTWHEHVSNAVNKAQSKIHAIRRIQRYFQNDEILQLLKTYCYPSLYYASNVWLTPSLNTRLKSKLFSASGKILSIIEINSYRNLHKKFTRATPEMWLGYELALSLYDLNLTRLPPGDWQILQMNTLHNRRSTKLLFTSTNKLRCGQNILPNRFKSITNRIDASWLSLSKEIYKQKCKNEFITTPLTLY